MVEGARSRRLAWRAECRMILRKNPEYREAENEQQRNRRLDPEYREAENKQQRNRWSDPEYRAREQVADTERHVVAHFDPEYREQENEQRRNRRSDPEYLVHENEQQRNRRTSTTYRMTYDMARTYKDGEFSFGQPCGKWNVPCVHGCGYFHLSSSMLGTRKKCCANGRMSISSKSCDSELLAVLELRDFPIFMQQAMSSSQEFCHQSSTYN